MRARPSQNFNSTKDLIHLRDGRLKLLQPVSMTDLHPKLLLPLPLLLALEKMVGIVF
jgi:hypothetical protein